jgi:hypothetical protein
MNPTSERTFCGGGGPNRTTIREEADVQKISESEIFAGRKCLNFVKVGGSVLCHACMVAKDWTKRVAKQGPGRSFHLAAVRSDGHGKLASQKHSCARIRVVQ